MKVEFNYNKLRGRIVEKYGNTSCFAKSFGISKASMSLKLNNKINFSSQEMLEVSELLEIPKAEIPDYFLTTKTQVQKGE